MDYLSAFDISVSGMNVEKKRVEVVAMNLANANTLSALKSDIYKPKTVIASSESNFNFQKVMSNEMKLALSGVNNIEIIEKDVEPRMKYEPGHPYADEKGLVAYPNINPASEMIQMMEAMRSYEANVKAFNATKAMANRALEIGSK